VTIKNLKRHYQLGSSLREVYEFYIYIYVLLGLKNINIYMYAGKNCFVWVGPKPRLFISEPEQIKDIFSKIDEFQKSRHPVANLLSTGVVSYEGDKWAKHRNIITPAFGNQNLKVFFLF
jgi:hypothetical protein